MFAMIRPSRSKFFQVSFEGKVNCAESIERFGDDVWYVNYEGVVMESIRLVDTEPNQSLKPFSLRLNGRDRSFRVPASRRDFENERSEKLAAFVLLLDCIEMSTRSETVILDWKRKRIVTVVRQRQSSGISKLTVLPS